MESESHGSLHTLGTGRTRELRNVATQAECGGVPRVEGMWLEAGLRGRDGEVGCR